MILHFLTLLSYPSSIYLQSISYPSAIHLLSICYSSPIHLLSISYPSPIHLLSISYPSPFHLLSISYPSHNNLSSISDPFSIPLPTIYWQLCILFIWTIFNTDYLWLTLLILEMLSHLKIILFSVSFHSCSRLYKNMFHYISHLSVEFQLFSHFRKTVGALQNLHFLQK